MILSNIASVSVFFFVFYKIKWFKTKTSKFNLKTNSYMLFIVVLKLSTLQNIGAPMGFSRKFTTPSPRGYRFYLCSLRKFAFFPFCCINLEFQRFLPHPLHFPLIPSTRSGFGFFLEKAILYDVYLFTSYLKWAIQFK